MKIPSIGNVFKPVKTAVLAAVSAATLSTTSCAPMRFCNEMQHTVVVHRHVPVYRPPVAPPPRIRFYHRPHTHTPPPPPPRKPLVIPPRGGQKPPVQPNRGGHVPVVSGRPTPSQPQKPVVVPQRGGNGTLVGKPNTPQTPPRTHSNSHGDTYVRGGRR